MAFRIRGKLGWKGPQDRGITDQAHTTEAIARGSLLVGEMSPPIFGTGRYVEQPKKHWFSVTKKGADISHSSSEPPATPVSLLLPCPSCSWSQSHHRGSVGGGTGHGRVRQPPPSPCLSQCLGLMPLLPTHLYTSVLNGHPALRQD